MGGLSHLRYTQAQGYFRAPDPHEDHRIKVWGPYGLNTPFWMTYSVSCETCRLAGASYVDCHEVVIVNDW